MPTIVLAISALDSLRCPTSAITDGVGQSLQSIAVIESIRAACLEVIGHIQLACMKLWFQRKFDRMRPRRPDRTASQFREIGNQCGAPTSHSLVAACRRS